MAASPTKVYWTDVDSGEVITVIFDAVTTLNPTDEVDVTEHPVEEGADVSDNARSKSGVLSMEATVSMVPNIDLDKDVGLEQIDVQVALRKPGAPHRVTLDIPSPPIQLSESGLLQAGIGAIVSLLSGAPKAQFNGKTIPSFVTVPAKLLQQDAPRNRVRAVYDTLLKLKDDHTLVTILTAHRDHFDMMMTSIGESRTTADGSSAKFQIDWKQVRTVSSSSVAAPKPAEPRGQPKVNKGSQNTKPAENPADKESLLKRGVDSVFSNF